MLPYLPLLTVAGLFGYVSASTIAMQVSSAHQVDYAVDGFPYVAPFSRYSDKVSLQSIADNHSVCFANTCINTSHVTDDIPEFGLGLSAYLNGHVDTSVLQSWKESGVITQMTFTQTPTTYNNTTVEIGGSIANGIPIPLDSRIMQIREENGDLLSEEQYTIDYDDRHVVTIPAPLHDHLVKVLGGLSFECSSIPHSSVTVVVGETWLELKVADFVVRNDGKCSLKATAGDVFSIDAISDHYTLGFDLEERMLWLASDPNRAITRTDLMIYGGGALSCILVLLFAFITFSPHRHYMQLTEDEESKQWNS